MENEFYDDVFWIFCNLAAIFYFQFNSKGYIRVEREKRKKNEKLCEKSFNFKLERILGLFCYIFLIKLNTKHFCDGDIIKQH